MTESLRTSESEGGRHRSAGPIAPSAGHRLPLSSPPPPRPAPRHGHIHRRRSSGARPALGAARDRLARRAARRGRGGAAPRVHDRRLLLPRGPRRAGRGSEGAVRPCAKSARGGAAGGARQVQELGRGGRQLRRLRGERHLGFGRGCLLQHGETWNRPREAPPRRPGAPRRAPDAVPAALPRGQRPRAAAAQPGAPAAGGLPVADARGGVGEPPEAHVVPGQGGGARRGTRQRARVGPHRLRFDHHDVLARGRRPAGARQCRRRDVALRQAAPGRARLQHRRHAAVRHRLRRQIHAAPRRPPPPPLAILPPAVQRPVLPPRRRRLPAAPRPIPPRPRLRAGGRGGGDEGGGVGRGEGQGDGADAGVRGQGGRRGQGGGGVQPAAEGGEQGAGQGGVARLLPRRGAGEQALDPRILPAKVYRACRYRESMPYVCQNGRPPVVPPVVGVQPPSARAQTPDPESRPPSPPRASSRATRDGPPKIHRLLRAPRAPGEGAPRGGGARRRVPGAHGGFGRGATREPIALLGPLLERADTQQPGRDGPLDGHLGHRPREQHDDRVEQLVERPVLFAHLRQRVLLRHGHAAGRRRHDAVLRRADAGADEPRAADARQRVLHRRVHPRLRNDGLAQRGRRHQDRTVLLVLLRPRAGLRRRRPGLRAALDGDQVPRHADAARRRELRGEGEGGAGEGAAVSQGGSGGGAAEAGAALSGIGGCGDVEAAVAIWIPGIPCSVYVCCCRDTTAFYSTTPAIICPPAGAQAVCAPGPLALGRAVTFGSQESLWRP